MAEVPDEVGYAGKALGFGVTAEAVSLGLRHVGVRAPPWLGVGLVAAGYALPFIWRAGAAAVPIIRKAVGEMNRPSGSAPVSAVGETDQAILENAQAIGSSATSGLI